MDPATMMIFCMVVSAFIVGGWKSGKDAVREEARMAREDIRNAIKARRDDLQRKIDDGGKSFRDSPFWWGAHAARSGWRAYRARRGPVAVGGKAPGPLGRIRRAAWEGAKAGAGERWNRRAAERNRPRPSGPGWSRRPRSGARPQGRKPRERRRPGTPQPGWKWRLDREPPPGPAPETPALGSSPRPPEPAPLAPASPGPVPVSGPSPAALPSPPARAITRWGELIPGTDHLWPGPREGQLGDNDVTTPNFHGGSSGDLAGPAAIFRSGRAGSLPALAAASGEAHNHGLWLASMAELQRWQEAHDRLMTQMLEQLQAADGGTDQVNGVIAYAEHVRTVLQLIKDAVAAVDPKEQHVINAVPGGDPRRINGMAYYTKAVEQS